jgi:hypothetical protein
MGHGRFVALEGPALGHLTAPAQAAQDLPDVRGMIAHPKVALNHGRQAFQRPPLVGKAVGPGALQSQRHPWLVWLVGQLAWSPRHRLGRQGPLAPCPPSWPPLADRAHRRLHPAGHRAQAQAVLQPCDGPASPPFQGVGGSIRSQAT